MIRRGYSLSNQVTAQELCSGCVVTELIAVLLDLLLQFPQRNHWVNSAGLAGWYVRGQ